MNLRMKKLYLCTCMLICQGVFTLLSAQNAVSEGTSDWSEFRFIINRGEVFSPTAPGELTELTLSGYFVVGEENKEIQLSPTKCANSYTLTGQAFINEYQPRVQTKVIATVPIPHICSPAGLFLTLVVDHIPMTVQLPYTNETDIWAPGFSYTYNVTVDGKGLIISGVTCSPIK